MRIPYLNAWSLLIITIGLIFSYPHLPKRTLNIYPGETIGNIYSGGESDLKTTISWDNKSQTQWSCEVPNTNSPQFCGLNFLWRNMSYAGGRDISDYESIKLNLRYQGSAKRIRLFIRNFDHRITTVGDGNSSQYIFTELSPKEINSGEISIPLEHFTVADWWIYQYNLSRKFVIPGFTNVTAIGVDVSENGNEFAGTHTFTIESLMLSGKIIGESKFYLSIQIIWMLTLLAYLLNQLSSQKATTSRYIHLQKELENENKKLEHLTDIDPLTHLLNRRGFQKKISFRGNQTNAQSVIMLLDIDHFKSINDSYGHNIGDIVLKSIAKVIETETRHQDLVARWGGEEFCIYCQVEHADGAITIAEKTRLAVSELEIDQAPNLKVTISIGMALFLPEYSLDDVIHQADINLYQAKETGRNKVIHHMV